jgi:predicted transcriptional regulator
LLCDINIPRYLFLGKGFNLIHKTDSFSTNFFKGIRKGVFIMAKKNQFRANGTITVTRKKREFTQIDNHVITMQGLTDPAFRIAMHILSVDEKSWKFTAPGIAKILGYSLDKTNNALKNLEAMGFLYRDYWHNEKGHLQVQYFFSEEQEFLGQELTNQREKRKSTSKKVVEKKAEIEGRNVGTTTFEPMTDFTTQAFTVQENQVYNKENSFKENLDKENILFNNCLTSTLSNRDDQECIEILKAYIFDTYYADKHIARWDKKNWLMVFGRFVSQLVKQGQHRKIKNLEGYINRAVLNMCFNKDVKNGRIDFDHPTWGLSEKEYRIQKDNTNIGNFTRISRSMEN